MLNDKNPRKEKPNPNAANPIQEHLNLQLHSLSLDNKQWKFRKPRLRCDLSEFRELSGQYAILCQFAAEGKY